MPRRCRCQRCRLLRMRRRRPLSPSCRLRLRLLLRLLLRLQTNRLLLQTNRLYLQTNRLYLQTLRLYLQTNRLYLQTLRLYLQTLRLLLQTNRLFPQTNHLCQRPRFFRSRPQRHFRRQLRSLQNPHGSRSPPQHPLQKHRRRPRLRASQRFQDFRRWSLQSTERSPPQRPAGVSCPNKLRAPSKLLRAVASNRSFRRAGLAIQHRAGWRLRLCTTCILAALRSTWSADDP